MAYRQGARGGLHGVQSGPCVDMQIRASTQRCRAEEANGGLPCESLRLSDMLDRGFLIWYT